MFRAVFSLQQKWLAIELGVVNHPYLIASIRYTSLAFLSKWFIKFWFMVVVLVNL